MPGGNTNPTDDAENINIAQSIGSPMSKKSKR